MTQQTNRRKLKRKLIPQAASVQLVYYLNLAPVKLGYQTFSSKLGNPLLE